MKIKIAPSILSADFSNLQNDVDKIINADYVHIDVMDGHFVPNITFGHVVIKNIKTKLIKFVHLMVENPDNYIEDFAKAKIDIISFHPETTKNPKIIIQKIKKLGMKASLALNPDKPLSKIKPFLNDIDMVLIMSVFPGAAGQEFIPSVLETIKKLRKLKPNINIAVDGGINAITAKQVIKAGANVLISGSFIYKSKNPEKTIELLRKVTKNI